MQAISAEDLLKVNSLSKLHLHCYIDGELLAAGIKSTLYTASAGSEESFSFGNSCAANVKIVVGEALPGLTGKTLQLTWSVDEAEYPLLVGTVEKASMSAGQTTIEAYDLMYKHGGKPFDGTEFQETCDGAVLLQAIAKFMEVEIDPDTLAEMEGVSVVDGLKDLAEDTSCGMAAGYLAGLVGKNALISREGLLTFRGYPSTDLVTEVYSGGAAAEGEMYTMTGITFQRETVQETTTPDQITTEERVTLEYSAGDGSLLLQNPLCDQSAADRVYGALGGLSYMPGSFSFPGGLLLEPGDLFSVRTLEGTYQTAAVTLTLELDGGCKATAASGGAVQDGGYSGTIHQALNSLSLELGRFQKLYADNAVIQAASIEELRAGKIYSNAIELIPKDSTGEADTLGRLVLWGYGPAGSDLVEKLSIEVYPYEEHNITPAILRTPAGLHFLQDEEMLIDLTTNSAAITPPVVAANGVRVREDTDEELGGVEVFNGQGGVTRISTKKSCFSGTLTVSGDIDVEIGDETKLPQKTSLGGRLISEDYATYGIRTEIPEDADLNGYVKIGNYACRTNAAAESLGNSPVSEAFSMNVYNCIGTDQTEMDGTGYAYFVQEITTISGIKWIRAIHSTDTGTVSPYPWQKVSGEYVSEFSTVGNWTYKKYTDGTVDLWCRQEVSALSTSQLGYAYRTAAISLDELPFPVLNPVKSLHFTPSTSYIAWPVETKDGTVELYRPNAGTISGTLCVTIHGNYESA